MPGYIQLQVFTIRDHHMHGKRRYYHKVEQPLLTIENMCINPQTRVAHFREERVALYHFKKSFVVAVKFGIANRLID